MYPKLVDQIAGGIAKAMQKATDSHAFHEFPDCLSLANSDRISIKLNGARSQIHQSLQRTSELPRLTTNSISFALRDEKQKMLIMMAEVQKGLGLMLKNEAGKSVMLVRLSSHTSDSVGKLMHPSQATLFKLMRNDGMNLSLVRANSEESVLMRVDKVLISLQSLGKAMGFLGSDCVYWLKSPDGQTVLGHIRTKIAISSNILVVKFMSSQRDVQKRSAMVGVALLLLLSEVYPQLWSLISSAD